VSNHKTDCETRLAISKTLFGKALRQAVVFDATLPVIGIQKHFGSETRTARDRTTISVIGSTQLRLADTSFETKTGSINTAFKISKLKSRLRPFSDF